MSYNFRNFRPLNLTTKLTTRSTDWVKVSINKNKATFINSITSSWMIADIDGNGNLSNFQAIDMSQKFGPNNMRDIIIHNNKAFIVNDVKSDWETADVPANWDGNPLNLTNFQTLNLSTKLTTTLGWKTMKIWNNKAFFANERRTSWMEADIDDQGNLTNFTNNDFPQLTTDNGWTYFDIYKTEAFFSNSNKSQWNYADIPDNWNKNLHDLGNATRLDMTLNLRSGFTVYNSFTIHNDSVVFFANEHRNDWFISDIYEGVVPWHYGDGAGGPNLTKNDWIGSWPSQTAQIAFEAIGTTLSNFTWPNLGGGPTGLSLPNLETINNTVQKLPPLVKEVGYLNLPKLDTVTGRSLNIFKLVPNSPDSTVVLQNKFNNDTDKDRFFGAGNWDQINFQWIIPIEGNRVIWNGKVCDTQFDWNGKTVAKFIWNGKECVLKPSGGTAKNFRTFTLPVTAGWSAGDISEDGKHIFLGSASKSLTSHDGGKTWTQFNNPYNYDPIKASISDDGQKIYTLVGNTGGYLSIDGGRTFSVIPKVNYFAVGKVGRDGKTIVLQEGNGLRISKDGGQNWTSHPDIQMNTEVLISKDGQKIVAFGTHKLHVSINGGDTWVEKTHIKPIVVYGTENLEAIAISAGTTLYWTTDLFDTTQSKSLNSQVSTGGHVYISKDLKVISAIDKRFSNGTLTFNGGTDWIQTDYAISGSDDGKSLYKFRREAKISTSDDGGKTFTEHSIGVSAQHFSTKSKASNCVIFYGEYGTNTNKVVVGTQ